MCFLFTMSDRTPDAHEARSAKLFSKGRHGGGDRSVWWSQTGSNRRPHACKARALPTELWPRGSASQMVGLGGLEPPTSRLSSARSNQLSYKPELLMLASSQATTGSSFMGRKRNEDGGVPQRRPDWPFDSKNSSREALRAAHRGISLERR
jgi:hypothetical protein